MPQDAVLILSHMCHGTPVHQLLNALLSHMCHGTPVHQLLNALLSHMCHGTRWISYWVPDWCVGLPVYQLLGIGGSVTTFEHVHAKLDQENFQRMARSRTSHRN